MEILVVVVLVDRETRVRLAEVLIGDHKGRGSLISSSIAARSA